MLISGEFAQGLTFKRCLIAFDVVEDPGDRAEEASVDEAPSPGGFSVKPM